MRLHHFARDAILRGVDVGGQLLELGMLVDRRPEQRIQRRRGRGRRCRNRTQRRFPASGAGREMIVDGQQLLGRKVAAAVAIERVRRRV